MREDLGLTDSVGEAIVPISQMEIEPNLEQLHMAAVLTCFGHEWVNLGYELLYILQVDGKDHVVTQEWCYAKVYMKKLIEGLHKFDCVTHVTLLFDLQELSSTSVVEISSSGTEHLDWTLEWSLDDQAALWG